MATITAQAWVNYYKKLSALDDIATKKIADFLTKYRGFDYNNANDMKRLIDYCYAVSTTYGEAAAAWACEMYDACGLASGLILDPAIPAEPADYSTVAMTVNGIAKDVQSDAIIAQAIGLLVKKSGQETTIQNAQRDDAEIAFIPHGDTCAFCITLGSKGWRDANDSELSKDGQPIHLHANCDCTYGVRFNDSLKYQGYKPEKYLKMYYDAPLDGQKPTSKNRINAMRREFYKKNKEKINEQKRTRYMVRKELKEPSAEETYIN